MTLSIEDLRARGVPDDVLKWRELRRERGLRLRNVATMIGVCENVLGEMEVGRRPMSGKMRRRLATFYGVEP